MSKKSEEMLFYKLIRSFLEVYLPKNRCYSPETVRSYRKALKLWRLFLKEKKEIDFTSIHFCMFTHERVYEFLDWLKTVRGNCPTSCNQRLAALKSFLCYCSSEVMSLTSIYLDVCTIHALKEPKKVVPYLSQNALKAILEQPDPKYKLGLRNRFLMILMYDTGARIQEILDLRLKDFHLDSNESAVFLTGKGRKTRSIPLMDRTIEHLKEYLRIFHPQSSRYGDNHLFYTIRKGITDAITQDTVSVFIKRYAREAKITCPEIPGNVHAHMFRHSRAMHLYQSGIPLSYVKDFLGHVNATTTSIYAIADPTMIRKALEKAAENGSSTPEVEIWKGNEDLILKLSGLE